MGMRSILLAAMLATTPVLASAQMGVRADAYGAVVEHYAMYKLKPGEPVREEARLQFGPVLKAALRRVSPPDGALGADPFCDCQDWDEAAFRADIGPARRVGRQYAVTVSVAAVGGEATSDITLMLDRYRGSWVVTDIIDANSGSLLRNARLSAPGSWANY